MAVVADGAGSGTGSLTRPVTLNIGGEKLIAVSPGLFDLLGENKISSMLSGCWEVLRDADDSIFLDYSPEVFMQLVEWLRHRRDSSPGTEVPVDVEPRYMAKWVCMMKIFSVELEQLVNAGVEKKVLRRSSLVFAPKGLDLFVSGDQLLRGAALNAVLIAEAKLQES
eukprot:s6063_g3.t1